MFKDRTFHLIGVGGVGMSGLARLLKALGARVSGCDLRRTATTEALVREGIEVFYGHHPSHLEGCEVVVYSSAISPHHPELEAARRHGIPVLPRAEMLAEIMASHPKSIAVAGSHGKTTTASMIAAVLSGAGLDPTVAVGGRVNNLGVNACLGKGEYLVAETDESDGSFLMLRPYIAVITNIDREHLDFYADFEAIKRAFLRFTHRVSPEGALVLCADDPGIREILPGVSGRFLTYGFTSEAELRGEVISREAFPRVRVNFRSRLLGDFRLPVPGLHNAENALAAIGVGLFLGLTFEDILKGLSSFRGVGRRLEFKGEVYDVPVFDDYAHHPRELRATLRTLRELFPERRILAVFQPHRYTRTRALWREFVQVLCEPDILFLTEIYPASERPLPGVTGESFYRAVKRIRGARPTLYAPDLEAVRAQVEFFLSPGDLVITLGAGDVYRVGEDLLRETRMVQVA